VSGADPKHLRGGAQILRPTCCVQSNAPILGLRPAADSVTNSKRLGYKTVYDGQCLQRLIAGHQRDPRLSRACSRTFTPAQSPSISIATKSTRGQAGARRPHEHVVTALQDARGFTSTTSISTAANPAGQCSGGRRSPRGDIADLFQIYVRNHAPARWYRSAPSPSSDLTEPQSYPLQQLSSSSR